MSTIRIWLFSGPGSTLDPFLVCRAGTSTAYPHPNQFYYHQIEHGDAIQLAGWVHLGGYVGECYRAVQLAPMNDLQKKTWEVHTQMTELQAELCRAGMACNEIASRVLKLPRDAGLEEFVYHRFLVKNYYDQLLMRLQRLIILAF